MMTHRRRRINLVGAAAVLVLSGTALAGEGAPRLDNSGAAVRLGAEQPEEAGRIEAGPGPAARYGAAGTEWVLFGGGAAYDFSNNTDVNLNIGYSRFLVDDVEWLLELATWYHDQEGDDAASLNPAMEFRWHFFNNGNTSVFLNVGIGVLVATDNVPDMGTGFDFTPRAGIGLTQAIGHDGTRLIAGLRWHHISNARINGEARNPSRDAPMLYVQFAIPF